MTVEAWLLFVATETVLCLSPGPAVLLVLSVSLRRGSRPGLQASAGILTANLSCQAARPAADTRTRTPLETFLDGVVVQGANPKTLLFFTALLPQFVDPAAPLTAQIAILAATSILIELAVLIGYAVLASRASGLAFRPAFSTLLNRVGGGLLIAAGAGLALVRRD